MRFLVTTLAVATLLGGSPSARAGFLVVESWETPAGNSPIFTFPSPWVGAGPQNGYYYSQIIQPSAGEFSSVNPLPAPADGNQHLRLGRNYSVSRLTGAAIQANTDYTLSVAIGNNNYQNFAYAGGTQQTFWSIQLWADTSGLGTFDGSVDTFIGQQYGTSGTATLPVPGNWALNTFTFNSATTPSLVGKELVILLGNGEPFFSVSNYDNVTLSTPDAVAAVPLPPSVLLLAAGLAGLPLLGGVRTRRGFRVP